MPTNSICFGFLLGAIYLASIPTAGWGWCILAAIITHEG